GLAALHRTRADRYGWPNDNYIGSLPQENGWLDDWAEFWRVRRLEPQLRLACDAGWFDSAVRARFDRFLDRLDEHRPPPRTDPPSSTPTTGAGMCPRPPTASRRWSTRAATTGNGRWTWRCQNSLVGSGRGMRGGLWGYCGRSRLDGYAVDSSRPQPTAIPCPVPHALPGSPGHPLRPIPLWSRAA